MCLPTLQGAHRIFNFGDACLSWRVYAHTIDIIMVHTDIGLHIQSSPGVNRKLDVQASFIALVTLLYFVSYPNYC